MEQSRVHGMDFSVVRFPNERKNTSRISSAMWQFSKVIEDL